MRLINTSLGEMADRLSILSLKLLYAALAEKPADHFRREQTLLLAKMRGHQTNGKWFDGYMELATVNGAIWQLQEEMVQYRHLVAVEKETLMTIGRIALRLQDLNFRRAELVRQIDVDAGEGDTGEEKL